MNTLKTPELCTSKAWILRYGNYIANRRGEGERPTTDPGGLTADFIPSRDPATPRASSPPPPCLHTYVKKVFFSAYNCFSLGLRLSQSIGCHLCKHTDVMTCGRHPEGNLLIKTLMQMTTTGVYMLSPGHQNHSYFSARSVWCRLGFRSLVLTEGRNGSVLLAVESPAPGTGLDILQEDEESVHSQSQTVRLSPQVLCSVPGKGTRHLLEQCCSRRDDGPLRVSVRGLRNPTGRSLGGGDSGVKELRGHLACRLHKAWEDMRWCDTAYQRAPKPRGSLTHHSSSYTWGLAGTLESHAGWLPAVTLL